MSHLDAAALRAAGRTPPMPCSVALGDGRQLSLLRTLRVLPAKRVVAEGVLGGQRVLAKLFIADASERHLRREREGIEALLSAGIATPEMLWSGSLIGGGHALLTRFLPDAVSLADVWKRAARAPGDAESLELLTLILAAAGHMHAAGLTQSDLHHGNFLIAGEHTWVIDGDSVERHTPLPAPQATANLAILLAQLPPGWDEALLGLLPHYIAAGGPPPDPASLAMEIHAVRQRRLNDLLGKSLRDCTLFAVRKSFTRFSSVVRDEAETLAPLLTDLDGAMQRGTLLKGGNTVTVAKVHVGERPLVIKRYNIKGFSHAVSRMLRPSRAWHSWLAAHRLQFFGIDTPRALGMIEERLGPLRRRAWLITEWSPGEALLDVLDADREPTPPQAAALRNTFETLWGERIHHGDLKATNLLWDDGRLVLIDLDATTAHGSADGFAKAWARDRARLLRNWPAQSRLTHWLDANLPPA